VPLNASKDSNNGNFNLANFMKMKYMFGSNPYLEGFLACLHQISKILNFMFGVL
jgi:hypothetical protein